MDERNLPGACGHSGPWHVVAAVSFADLASAWYEGTPLPAVTSAQVVACECGRTYRVDGVTAPVGPPPRWEPGR